MPETYNEVRAVCGLSGHYRRFIKNFACLAHVLYDLLGYEVKMGLVVLTHEAKVVVRGTVYCNYHHSVLTLF